MYHPNDRLEIGNFCSIAGGSYLLAGGEHNIHHTTTYPFSVHYRDQLNISEISKSLNNQAYDISEGIKIGSDVWIGFRAMVLSGVTIGHGAVLGAGCVVAKDIPPFAVVVGNPARIIKYRFDKSIIDELLSIQWWDWSLNKILQFAPLLENEPKKFVEEVRRIGPDALAAFYEIPAEENLPLLKRIDVQAGRSAKVVRLIKRWIPKSIKSKLREIVGL
jgi:hypothetical protein